MTIGKSKAIKSMVAVAALGIAVLKPVALDVHLNMNAPVSNHRPEGPSNNETYLWKRVRIGGGGFITGLDMDPSGKTRVARADVHGAYVWLENHKRWTQLVTTASMPERFHQQSGFNEGVYEIVVAPSEPRRIFMALKGHVFRSDNQGVTFSETNAANHFPVPFDPNGECRLAGPFMAISPRDPDLLLFGTPESGLLRTSNGGKSWSAIQSVPSAIVGVDNPQRCGMLIWFQRAMNGSTPRVWVLSPGHGVFVSEDEGATFRPLSKEADLQPKTLSQGAFAPDSSFYGVDSITQQAWRYRNSKWVRLSGNNLPTRAYGAVAVDPRSSEIFISDHGGKIYTSSDGGYRWRRLLHQTQVGKGEPPWLRISNQSYFAMGRITFDPNIPGRIWAAAGVGVFYADLSTRTHVVTWVSQTRGIEELVANDISKSPGRPPMFAVWDFGVHVKDDLDAFSTTYGPKERVLIAAQELATTAADPAFVVTNASDTRIGCCSEDGDAVLAGFTLDGGRTWAKFPTLPQPPGTNADDPWRMSFGTIAVSSGNTTNIIWVPTFNRSPFYTKDRGNNWHRVVFTGEKLPNTGSHSNLHLPRRTLVADSVQAGVFYLVHSGEDSNAAIAGLWKTEDGGDTWQVVHHGEIAPDSRHAAKLRAMPGRAGDLFFTSSVAGLGDRRLRRSRDGGRTWSAFNDVDHVDDVAFGKPAKGLGIHTIFLSGRVSGQYGLWRSVDDARTWVRVGTFPIGSLDQVNIIRADPDIFGRVYIGYMGSGFVYGEPTSCHPESFRFAEESECVAVQ